MGAANGGKEGGRGRALPTGPSCISGATPGKVQGGVRAQRRSSTNRAPAPHLLTFLQQTSCPKNAQSSQPERTDTGLSHRVSVRRSAGGRERGEGKGGASRWDPESEKADALRAKPWVYSEGNRMGFALFAPGSLLCSH